MKNNWKKNFINLILYSFLILSVMDFFHFANHAFTNHSHISTSDNSELSYNKLIDYNSALYNNVNHSLLAKSESCHVCSSLLTFSAVVYNNLDINFYASCYQKISIPAFYSHLKSLKTHNSRAPPYWC